MERSQIIEDKIKLTDSLTSEMDQKGIKIRISFNLQKKIELITTALNSNSEIEKESTDDLESRLDSFISIAQDMLSGKFREKCTTIYSTSFTDEQKEEAKKYHPDYYGN